MAPHTGHDDVIVRVLDADPELGRGLAPAQAAAARNQLIATVETLPAGVILPPRAVSAHREGPLLGFLVLDGVLTRRVVLGGRRSVELLGAGDMVCAWRQDSEYVSVPFKEAWTPLRTTRVAVLDRQFELAVVRWPGVLAELMGRAAQRFSSLALRLAIAQLPRLESRLLALLWHLADRWGTVGPHGVGLPLRLSHETLGDLVCAQRASVTLALKHLAESGRVTRAPGGRFTLHGEPPGAELLGASRARAFAGRLQAGAA
jgi:CRP/FNR family transcriptional regulator, cyclic AMP receptor protein